MDPTCHTPTTHLPVLYVAVMAPRALPKLPAAVLAVVEADPGFPAVERRQVVHEAFPSSPPASLPFAPRSPLLFLLAFAMDGV